MEKQAEALEQSDITTPTIFVKINNTYKDGMTELGLYEATRGFWPVGVKCEKAQLAMPVYKGIILEVYRIHSWHPVGTFKYATRDAQPYIGSKRMEFIGEVDQGERHKYIGKSIKQLPKAKGQNSFFYMNC